MRSLKQFKREINDKIQDFLYKNKKVRAVRNFIYNIFLPYFLKIFFTIAVFFLIIFIALKTLKPELLQRANNKISAIIFEKFNLDNFDFSDIRISGVKYGSKEKIIEIVKKTKPQKGESLLNILAQKIKKEQDWAQKVTTSRTLPNKLNITIEEYIPFAIWQNKEKKYVIDRDGNKIEIDNDNNFSNLLLISGENANLNVKTLFNILAISPEISAKVYSASWIGNRRWNIYFENGLLVKLPSLNLNESWQDLIEIYNTKGALRNLKIIDLRIKNKTYLEYKR
jgi:cell division protein FtsQ